MSRSYKKTPICKIAGTSDKQSKRIANRNYRHTNNMLLKDLVEDFEPINMNVIANGNVWSFASDGRSWFGTEKFSVHGRKYNWTKEDIKRLMRK